MSNSKAIVQVVRRGETEPQFASKLVAWICAMGDWTKPVKVGDIVVEVTHRIGMARSGLGLHSAIGELLKIEKGQYGEIYTVLTIEGEEQRWENAKMVFVSKGPLNPPTP